MTLLDIGNTTVGVAQVQVVGAFKKSAKNSASSGESAQDAENTSSTSEPTLAQPQPAQADFLQQFSLTKIRHISVKKFRWADFNRCFYICVNDALMPPKIQLFATNRIDLAPFFALRSDYKGLGADRAAACYALEDGVIVDAGSAITVDVMENGLHKGGFILPGLSAFLRSYELISLRLKHNLNTAVNLKALPNHTRDAISYGTIFALTNAINTFAAGRRICLTGGDARFLVQFLPNAYVDQNLVFSGMLRAISEQTSR